MEDHISNASIRGNAKFKTSEGEKCNRTIVELAPSGMQKYPTVVTVCDYSRRPSFFNQGEPLVIEGALSIRKVDKDGKTYHNIVLTVN